MFANKNLPTMGKRDTLLNRKTKVSSAISSLKHQIEDSAIGEGKLNLNSVIKLQAAELRNQGEVSRVSSRSLHPSALSDRPSSKYRSKQSSSAESLSQGVRLLALDQIVTKPENRQFAAELDTTFTELQPGTRKAKPHTPKLCKFKPMPVDVKQLNVRHRKILQSLNQSKLNKEPEYKNYESTDSDLYEEEDYTKIDIQDVHNEPDFLRKRRLERRYAKKRAILEKRRLERIANNKQNERQRLDATPTRARLPDPKKKTAPVMGAEQLREQMKRCRVPHVTERFGTSKSKVDSNLDDECLNPVMASKRAFQRKIELAARMLDPLTYPSSCETIESQNIVVPSEEEMAMLADQGKLFFGDSQMESLVSRFRSRQGIIVGMDKKSQQAHNPALLREAFRPSMVHQHIRFQERKLAERKRQEQLVAQEREKNKAEPPSHPFTINVDVLQEDHGLQLPAALEYSPVPPVDEQGRRPCSKLSSRLSGLREHRRSAYRLALSQKGSQAQLGSAAQLDAVSIPDFDAISQPSNQSRKTKSKASRKSLGRSASQKSHKAMDLQLNTPQITQPPRKTRNTNTLLDELGTRKSGRVELVSRDKKGLSPSTTKRGQTASRMSELSSRHMKFRMYQFLEKEAKAKAGQARLKEITSSIRQMDSTIFTPRAPTVQEKAFQLNHQKNCQKSEFRKGYQVSGYLNKRNRYHERTHNKTQAPRPNPEMQHIRCDTETADVSKNSRAQLLPLMNSETSPIPTKIENSFMSQLSPLVTHRSNQFNTQRERFNKTTNSIRQDFTSPQNGKSSLGKNIHRQLASIQAGISDLYQQSVQEQEPTKYNSTIDQTTDAETRRQTQSAWNTNNQVDRFGLGQPKISIMEQDQEEQARNQTAFSSPRGFLDQKILNPLHQKRQSAYEAQHRLTSSNESEVHGDLESKLVEMERTILSDWGSLEKPESKRKKLEQYEAAMKSVTDKHGGFPEFKLSQLPPYRTEKHTIIKKTRQQDETQFIPAFPKCVRAQFVDDDYSKTKINASFLAQQKQKQIYTNINQILMCLFDEPIQQKYYQYMKNNNLVITTDVYERMDLHRRIVEGLRKLQTQDNLTEDEFQRKKAALMRKIAHKGTKHLYAKVQSEKKQTIEERLLKYADKMKYDPGQQGPVDQSPTITEPLDGASPGKSPRRRLTQFGNNIKEEDSDMLSNNASLYQNSEVEEVPEPSEDDSELDELKAKIGFVNPITTKKKAMMQSPTTARSSMKSNALSPIRNITIGSPVFKRDMASPSTTKGKKQCVRRVTVEDIS